MLSRSIHPYSSPEARGSVLLVLLAMSYSVFGLLSRLSYADLGTFSQVAVRSGVALLLTLPFLGRSFEAITLSRRDLALLLSRGVLMYGISIPCYIQAVNTGYLGIVALIAALPFSSLFGVLLYKERPAPIFWIGLLLATVGLVPLVHNPLIASLYSILMGLASSVTFALALVLRRSQSPSLTDSGGNIYLLGIGLMMSCLGAFITGESMPRLHSSALVLNLAGGALVAINAYIASAAFRIVSATRAGSLLMAEPLFSLVLGSVVFDEQLSKGQYAGAAVVLAGIITSGLSSRLFVRLGCLRPAAQIP